MFSSLKTSLYAPYSAVVLSLGASQPTEAENRALHKGAVFAKGQPLISQANRRLRLAAYLRDVLY